MLPSLRIKQKKWIMNKMGKKHKFDNTIKSLKDNNSFYTDNVWKTVGFFIIILGWLGTSPEIKSIIHDEVLYKSLFSTALILCEINRIFMEIQFYTSAQKLAKEIESEYIDIVKIYLISKKRAIANSLVVTILIVSIFTLILTL